MSRTAGATVNSVLDQLVSELKRAGQYNRNDQVPPVAVLWTDEARWWERVLPLVRRRVTILTLGEYKPEELRGPAIWVRCALARLLPDVPVVEGVVPVVYLPGIGRHDLRAMEGCPRELEPLAELRFRAAWFTQGNTNDWTPQAMLSNPDRGLGLQVGFDQATNDALGVVLARLVEEPLERLRAAMPLTAPSLHGLVEHDPVGSMLRWMDNAESLRRAEEWPSFCALARKRLAFDPERDTSIGAAERMASRDGEWVDVWQRYAAAPTSYPHIPELLRIASRPADLFSTRAEPWPQDNDDAEVELRAALHSLHGATTVKARDALEELDRRHGDRRQWVWAKLGHAPLADALEPLTELAHATQIPVPESSLDQAIEVYARTGWQADEALLRSLGAVERTEDLEAVCAAATALYRPWAEAAANSMTKLIAGRPPSSMTATTIAPGTCLVFTDGLRYDLGHRLRDNIAARGCEANVEARLAALPTITATAKPAISPVAHLLAAGVGLGTVVAATGSTVTADGLRKLMAAEGIQPLANSEVGDPLGRAWTEVGDIDARGHRFGPQLARHVGSDLDTIAERVVALLRAGWKRVEVVTDHGWLLEPDSLDKVEPDLPAHLTDVRKGRCARLKDTAPALMPEVPWAWDSSVRIAIAPGLKAFVHGKQYEHGGAAPQECVVPRIIVSLSTSASAKVSIASVRWVGLRCHISSPNATAGTIVDIRERAADAESSIAARAAALDDSGHASLLVADDSYEGDAAVVVLLAPDGTVLGQRATVVGRMDH